VEGGGDEIGRIALEERDQLGACRQLLLGDRVHLAEQVGEGGVLGQGGLQESLDRAAPDQFPDESALLLGPVENREGRRSTVTLTPTGRAAALTALRARAHAPRTTPWA
jgi:hypothetical protein